jgi:predicted ATPase
MEKLLIQNFKCFQKVEIPLNRLTVFAGANGNGKSTAIQALLFLRRTVEHCSKWENDHYEYTETNGLKVELNGAYCLVFGDSSSISNRVKEEAVVHLGIQNDAGRFRVSYAIESSQLWLEPIRVEGSEYLKNSGLFTQEFYYLNAERIGPRISQSIQFFDYPNTGFQGEFVAQLIGDTEFSYKFKVAKSRWFEGLNNPRLEQQVNAWLDYLIPGVSITAKYDTTTGTAQIRAVNHYTKGESVIAPNIGFGISYVLPILVTGLIAKEGSFMVVENPEAHLHPSAQSRIGRFLSMVAAAGVKVIVETHSDHVVNGIQVAAASSIISPELVSVNFFSQNEEMTQPNVQTISINEMGELSNWPYGFFDQSQIDYRTLLKLRRNE